MIINICRNQSKTVLQRRKKNRRLVWAPQHPQRLVLKTKASMLNHPEKLRLAAGEAWNRPALVIGKRTAGALIFRPAPSQY